jgi:hypothetical protein
VGKDIFNLCTDFRGNLPLVVLVARVEVHVVYILSTTILYLTLTNYQVSSQVSNDIVTTMTIRSHELLPYLNV